MNTSRITSIFATRARKFGKRTQKTRTSTHLCTGMYTVHVTKHFELTCIYSNDAFRVDASVKLLMQMVNFWNIWAIKSVMWICIHWNVDPDHWSATGSLIHTPPYASWSRFRKWKIGSKVSMECYFVVVVNS